VQRGTDGDAVFEERILARPGAEPEELVLRVLFVVRGGAFAEIALPDDPAGRGSYGEAAVRLRRTLRSADVPPAPNGGR
jgi:hypothetical protein